MRALSIYLFVGFLMFSCKNNENKDQKSKADSLNVETQSKSELEYTCPMHPEVIRKEPGTCPECGMELQVRS